MIPTNLHRKSGRRVRVGLVPAVTAAVALVLVAPAAAQAAPTPELGRKLGLALRVPHVAPARSGAIAIDLTTNTLLFAQNSSRALAPASNEKLPLTYAALALLGPSYRIETDVLGEGDLDGTLWRGRIVLKGGGDPTLSTADLRALAQQVRAAGVRRVSGGIVADESWFDARRTVSGWKPSFFLDESPPLSALAVDRDRFRGYLSRTPALSTATAFAAVLNASGVIVDGGVAMGVAGEYAFPLASVNSPPLWSILRYMDRESDNYTAELLLKQLGATQLHHGTSVAGAQVAMRTLGEAGVPMAGVRIVDGSGLSQLDRLTADALSGILRAAWINPAIRSAFLAALPVAGVNGTLQDRLRRPPARGNVLAKTGTTREASALSGFVRNRYVFAVVQNGNPLSYWWARKAQDRFAMLLAAQ